MTKQVIIQDSLGDIKFGDVIEKEFPLESDIYDNFHYWNSSCGQCTTVSIDNDSKKVKIKIDTNLSGVQPGNILHKYAYIYLNKDIQHYIADKSNRMVDNPEKPKITYILTANII